MSTQTATDFVTARTTVSAVPTTTKSSSGAQACASWLECIRAKPAAVMMVAGTTPIGLASAGYRKPRKNNSSTAGATRIPKAASMYAEAGGRKYSSIRRGFWVLVGPAGGGIVFLRLPYAPQSES